MMITRKNRPATLGFALVVGLVVSAFAAATAVAVSTGTRQIPSGGTTTIRAGALGADEIQQPEIREGSDEDEGAGSFNRPRPGFKNGKFPKQPLDAPVVTSSPVAASNPELALTFQGLNHRDQRLANGGNQFSLEPPDQALCVGNGYTVESTNSVIRVWSTAGAPLTGVQDLNTFFGYPAAINRTTGVIGPERDRPRVPLRPRPPALHGRHHHAIRGRERRLQREEHDRSRGVATPATRRARGRSTTSLRRTTARTARRTTGARSTARPTARASRTTRTSARTRTVST